RVNLDETLIKTAREIGKDLFNAVNLPSDEDRLIRELLARIAEKKKQIENDYLKYYESRKYPGEDLVRQGLTIFEELEKYQSDHTTLLNKLKEYQEDLWDWDENMKMIHNFFKNQRVIFDKGQNMLKRIEDNQSYLQETEFLEKTADLQAIIADPVPYPRITQIPDLTAWLDKRFEASLNLHKENSRTAVQKDHEQLEKALLQYGLGNGEREKFTTDIDNWYEDKYKYIDDSAGFERLDAAITQSANYRDKMLGEIEKAIAAKQEKIAGGGGGGSIDEPEYHVLEIKEIAPVDDLRTEEDVDNYVNNLGKTLKSYIKKKKVIRFGR
ncbi:MAG: hypothetical protein PHR04_09790, partial [Syntrophomonadaceae bacterium]|nr:hypothetical protein [Syntrophomonadaceae bacterium]